MPTPLAQARNLGPLTAAELEAAGIPTLEALVTLGWEEALARWVARFPERANVNAACALAGAVLRLDWRRLPGPEKARARALARALRAAGR